MASRFSQLCAGPGDLRKCLKVDNIAENRTINGKSNKNKTMDHKTPDMPSYDEQELRNRREALLAVSELAEIGSPEMAKKIVEGGALDRKDVEKARLALTYMLDALDAMGDENPDNVVHSTTIP